MGCEFLSELGLTHYDIALLILCPLGAIVGSIAQASVLSIDLHTPPIEEKQVQFASRRLAGARMAWMLLRLNLGATLGFVTALYFIGAIQENLPTLAKITALSILLGYAAPKVWIAQEKLLVDRVREMIGRELSSRRQKAESKSNGPDSA
jgi:hypothetical protein